RAPAWAGARVYPGRLPGRPNTAPRPGAGAPAGRAIASADGPPASPQRQSLDLYLPPNQTGFPVVFLAYGGQFTRGDKARLGYLGRTLAREGLGVVAIDYRRTDHTPEQVVHPGHVEDVAQAFAWTYRHMAGSGGDPAQIVLMGPPGAAPLVSLLATDRRYLGAHGLSPDLVRGVIGVSAGLYAFHGPSEPFGDQWWEASPLRYVDG